jgi:hypothetical protein
LTANPSSSRAGWIAVIATICIWTGFILVTRHGGKGVLTGMGRHGALRFGVGALIAVFFLPRITLPPLKVIALFSALRRHCLRHGRVCRLPPGAGGARLGAAARRPAFRDGRHRMAVARA